MPTMSKIPTTASRPAAVVSGMPWSWADGMKWVPISPLVVAPQMAKPGDQRPERADPAGALSTCSARTAAFGGVRLPRTGVPGAARQAGSAPHRRPVVGAVRQRRRRRPVSCCRNFSTSGTTASAPAAISSEACRQPGFWASAAMNGRNTSCPAALPAVRMPITRPRLLTNQVLAMVAANTSAIDPVPRPISRPQVSRICHDWLTSTVSALPGADQHERARRSRARMPKRSIRAAANGAVRPNSTRLMLTAADSDRGGPAELALQRHHQHAGRGPESGGAHQGEERDGGHDPGRVDAAPGSARAGCGSVARSCRGSVPCRVVSGAVARGTGSAVRVRLCQLVFSAVSRSPHARAAVRRGGALPAAGCGRRTCGPVRTARPGAFRTRSRRR